MDFVGGKVCEILFVNIVLFDTVEGVVSKYFFPDMLEEVTSELLMNLSLDHCFKRANY